MLKSYFAVQPRPKRDEINRLSQELNFPPRVIQVWFQNARARDRREALYNVNSPLDYFRNRHTSDIYAPAKQLANEAEAEKPHSGATVDEDQPLDLTVKKTMEESVRCPSGADEKPIELTVPRPPVASAGLPQPQNGSKTPDYARENGIHPKKRSWIKIEEEDDSFPHEIEEWKKTFASGLCRYQPLRPHRPQPIFLTFFIHFQFHYSIDFNSLKFTCPTYLTSPTSTDFVDNFNSF